MPDGGQELCTTYYCRLCGDKARGFEKGLVLPYSLFLTLVIAVMELVRYFQDYF